MALSPTSSDYVTWAALYRPRPYNRHVMKALVLEQPGSKPRLALRDLPTPPVTSDQVLVQVQACGFCYHDLLVMWGVLRRGVTDGLVLGHEISGVVVAAGPDVDTLNVGDRVASIQTDACGSCDRCSSGLEHRCVHGRGIGHTINGGFAEYVRVRSSSLVKLPSNIDVAGACLLGCPMGVVHRAITQIGKVSQGETVLVTGASGGLGSHAVQLAKASGAEVYAVTRSESKVPAIEGLGTAQVICMGELEYSEVVLALTEDTGVNVALDTVGSPMFDSTFRCLAQYGRLVLLGEVSGQPVPLALAEAIFRDVAILGSSGSGTDDLRSSLDMVQEGRIRPVIAGHFPLERWPEAYAAMTEGAHVGRLVFTPTQ